MHEASSLLGSGEGHFCTLPYPWSRKRLFPELNSWPFTVATKKLVSLLIYAIEKFILSFLLCEHYNVQFTPQKWMLYVHHNIALLPSNHKYSFSLPIQNFHVFMRGLQPVLLVCPNLENDDMPLTLVLHSFCFSVVFYIKKKERIKKAKTDSLTETKVTSIQRLSSTLTPSIMHLT